MTSLDEFITTVNATEGNLHPLYDSLDLTQDHRIPTGIFPVDLALAGGIPLSHSCILYGAEGGGKTTTAISIMASVSRMCFRCFNHILSCSCDDGPYRMKSAWIDVEGTLSHDWARALGAVHEMDYIYRRGGHAEQVFALAGEALKVDEIALIVIDSIASLVSREEVEADREKKSIAPLARVVTPNIKYLKCMMLEEGRRGHPVSILYLNQVRDTIGIVYGGSGEYFPGGHALKHESSLTLRVSKKSLFSQKAKYFNSDNEKWTASLHNVTVDKAKVATLMGSSEFIRANQEIPDLGLKKGQVDDLALMEKAARQFGFLTQENGWTFDGTSYRTLKAIREFWSNHPDTVMKLKRDLIDAVIKETTDDGQTGERASGESVDEPAPLEHEPGRNSDRVRETAPAVEGKGE